MRWLFALIFKRHPKNKKLNNNVIKVACIIFIAVALSFLYMYIKARYARAGLSYDRSTDTYTLTGPGSWWLNNNFDNHNLVLDGIVAYISDVHHYKSLTIRNNAILTHDVLTNAEAANNGSSSNKKIELVIDNDLILSSGGKISTTGKGSPGGISGQDGKGTGGGKGGPAGWANGCAGGGGYGGKGGDGGCPTRGRGGGINYNGGVAFSNYTVLNTGSGGGSVTAGPPVAVGGGGGGRIKITTGSSIQFLSSSTAIEANGGNGGNGFGMVAGGGGAGGTIWLNTPKIIYYAGYNSSTNVARRISVAGGTTQHAGQNGNLDRGGYAGILANIYAKGGNGHVDAGWTSGGGGGGGVIKITGLRSVGTSCIISPDAIDNIPAQCEHQDVTINAFGSVNKEVFADSVKINQRSGDYYSNPVRAECINQNNPDCDTRRRFNNLTLTNGAILTHRGVTTADMSEDVTPVGGNRSLADETTGSARWKKVDLEIEKSLVLTGGSTIDVNYKGYGAPLDGEHNEAACVNIGYGPGAGQSSMARWISINSAGGGSYGGRGGTGIADSACTGGPTYGDPSAPNDFGSNGGSCWSNGKVAGYNGGGRVKIVAKKEISIVSANSYITASGLQGGWGHFCAPGMGSGGSIWLITPTLTTPAVGGIVRPLSVARGGSSWASCAHFPQICGGDGTVRPLNAPAHYTNIFAQGGTTNRNGGAGGGGRIAINQNINWTVLTVTVVDDDLPHNAIPGADVDISGTEPLGGAGNPAFHADGWTDVNGQIIFDHDEATNQWMPSNRDYIIKVKKTGYENNYPPDPKFTIDSDSDGVDSITIRLTPRKSKISGDVYGPGGNVDLKDYKIDSNSIIAGKTISLSTKGGVQIHGYTNPGDSLNWGKIKVILAKTKNQLKAERVKYWCDNWVNNSKPKLGCRTTTTISTTWNLQNGRNTAGQPLKSVSPGTSVPAGYRSNPEGEVWYINGNLLINGDTTYYGRGTVIVEGNLYLRGNLLPDAADPNAMIGFIVLSPADLTMGVAYIETGAKDVRAVIYTEGATATNRGIYIPNRLATNPLTFKGLLASEKEIILPAGKGVGSSFMYDGRLAENPLPGFKQIMGSLITQKGETTP